MKGNLFENIPDEIKEELFERIGGNENVRIERIISQGQSSPPGFWYDESLNEFVMLLSGKAKIIYESGEEFVLNPGDYLDIKSRVKHRVEWTDEKRKTVWLAVYY